MRVRADMSTYTLSGSGTQALTANTTALHVSITTIPAMAGAGNANPTNYYSVGLLRPGDGTGYFDAIPVTGGPQWIGLPNGTTTLAYHIFGSGVISVVEVIGGVSPFVGPPGATGSTGATGPTGPTGPAGSSGVIATASNVLSSPVNTTTAGTWYDGPSVSLAAGTWLVTATITGTNGSGGATLFAVKLWDGTNLFASTETWAAVNGQNYSLTVSALVVLSSTTTVKASASWNNNGGQISSVTVTGNPIPSTANASQINAIQVA